MMIKKILLCTFSIHILTGCGSESAEVMVSKNITAVPVLNEMQLTTTPLRAASTEEFQLHLRNGVFLRSLVQNRVTLEGTTTDSYAVSSTGYSTTVTQEQGVDEGDRVKYDGQYIYLATNPYYQQSSQISGAWASIRIARRGEQGDLSTINEVPLLQEGSTVDNIYITADKLAAFSNSHAYSIYAADSFAGANFFPTEQSFTLSLIDISSPADATLTQSYTIDGRLIDSRRIGNKLYFISSYAPYVGLPFADDSQTQLENYRKVFTVPVNELLPQITNNQGVAANLVDSADCFIPENADKKDGFDGLVTLTVIDMAVPESIESICVNSDVQGLYASTSSIYLYGTHYYYDEQSQVTEEGSVIHKFELKDNTIEYRASGKLSGHFGWQHANLRFSEQESFLRVVTSQGDRTHGYTHQLNVLSEGTAANNNTLNIIAQLPNDTFPQKIGKVSAEGIVQEDVKAVRFVENLAYVVTFLNTDPLYVVDLNDPLNPYISGELEIPGYSSYLHPISEQLILGVGQNIDVRRLEGGQTDNENNSPIVEGAKVSLFDVSNINSPREIASLVFPKTYTPVEFNYHALTYLKTSTDQHRFGLPMEQWQVTTMTDSETGNTHDTWTASNYLALIEVTGSDSNAQLKGAGNVTPITDDNREYQNYISGWDDRAIFHQDDLYYLHGNEIWRAYWHDPKLVTGPF